MWKTCPVHFEGQLHPNTRALLLDDAPVLAEEERKARIRFQIAEKREYIAEMQRLAREGQATLFKLELELVNRTATVRNMAAVKLSTVVERDDQIVFLDGDGI